MPKNLSEVEEQIMQLFFDIRPQWREPIYNQIQVATLQREENFSNYSVLFEIDRKSAPLNVKVRMPIEIIIGQVVIPKDCAFNIINGFLTVSPCVLSVTDINTIGIRIYFDNGYLKELEVYNLAGKQLDKKYSLHEQRTYIVSEKDD